MPGESTSSVSWIFPPTSASMNSSTSAAIVNASKYIARLIRLEVVFVQLMLDNPANLIARFVPANPAQPQFFADNFFFQPGTPVTHGTCPAHHLKRQFKGNACLCANIRENIFQIACRAGEDCFFWGVLRQIQIQQRQ